MSEFDENIWFQGKVGEGQQPISQKNKNVENDQQPKIKTYIQIKNGFEQLSNKMQLAADKSYKMFQPLTAKIFGYEEGTNLVPGAINKILEDWKRHRSMENLISVRQAKETLEAIQEYKGWTQDYVEYLENCFKGLQEVCQDSLSLIKEKEREIDEGLSRIAMLEEDLKNSIPKQRVDDKEYLQEQLKRQGDIVKPMEQIRKELHKDRKIELQKMYYDCKNNLEYATLINRPRNPMKLSVEEMDYIRFIHKERGQAFEQKYKQEGFQDVKRTTPLSAPTPPQPQNREESAPQGDEISPSQNAQNDVYSPVNKDKIVERVHSEGEKK